MSRPESLFAEWSKIRRAAGRARRVFLFLDFDGTLAPIRAKPEQVWLAADLRRLLTAIRRGGATLAIISGRGLRDVRRRAAIRGIWYAGAHGYFLEPPRGRSISLLRRAQSTQIAAVLRNLRKELRGLPGIQVEAKEATVAVHYRRAAPSAEKQARQIVQKTAKRHANLKIMQGKKVWEILPSTRIDKWTAVRAILAKENYRASRDLLFYFGDDTTDEAVFRNMKGISVAVGKQSGTAAGYFVRSPAEVERFLEALEAIHHSPRAIPADSRRSANRRSGRINR